MEEGVVVRGQRRRMHACEDTGTSCPTTLTTTAATRPHCAWLQLSFS